MRWEVSAITSHTATPTIVGQSCMHCILRRERSEERERLFYLAETQIAYERVAGKSLNYKQLRKSYVRWYFMESLNSRTIRAAIGLGGTEQKYCVLM